jgi:hypothetical protein|tara:strand:- start:460 stop:579 length:120 start_codon:yes stop_codon:yes gene_type:complete
MSELRRITMDILITLIYEAKKHREFIYGMLIGILIGKLS